jgi:transcription elongation factor GreA
MAKFVTKEGLEKLKEELEYLKTTKQKELAERLRRAIAFGDLSENFEYADAKDEQIMLQTRIAEVENEIREAKVVESDSKSGRVQVGSVVHLEAENSKMAFTIVTGKEANPLEGKISAESPVGACLLGKKVGEKCTADLPSGPVAYRILKIE